MYSYREFLDLQSDGILSHEEKLAKRNLEIMRKYAYVNIEDKDKPSEVSRHDQNR